MLVAIAAVLSTLILVVGVHELGHAVVALLLGVTVKKISIGFGRPVIHWQSKGGCEWVWACWPLGGYVQLLNSRISPVEPQEYGRCFDKKPIWNRLVILTAGSFANLMLAWVAFVCVFLVGIGYKLPVIQSVVPHSIAAQAGFLVGDQLLAIEGHATRTWADVGMGLVEAWGNEHVHVRVKSQNHGVPRLLQLNLSQIQFSAQNKSLMEPIGIMPHLAAPDVLLRASSLLAAMQQANQTIAQQLYFFLMMLKQLLFGVIPFATLLGPLGLFTASIASLMQGLVVFMYFIASLSLAVAVVNLAPIPGLDGGSILYAVLEKLRGKPVSIAMEVLIHRLLFIVLCLFLVQLLLNDLQRV
ncbi:MAG: M50 family metallopeptidase [Legionellales bacterium]